MAVPRKFVLFLAFLVLASALAAGSVWVFLGALTPPSEPDGQDSQTPPLPPEPPGMLLAVPGNSRVLLAWTPPETDGGSPILGYAVYAGTYPSLLASLDPTLFFTDVGLTNGVVYVYRVAAYNAVGLSKLTQFAAVAPGDFDASVFAFPRFGVAPLRVEFTLSLIDPALRNLGTSVWDFGDGSQATVAIFGRGHAISHTYGNPGVYMVTTAYGEEGHEFPGPKIPIIVLPPIVLEAVANPTTGTAPLTASFRATASGGLPPHVVGWDFGDGTGIETDAAEHTYEVPGSYNATVSVRDAAGHEAVQTFEIRVMAPFSWGVLVDFGWVVAVLIAVGASGFVLGRLYEARRRTPRQ